MVRLRRIHYAETDEAVMWDRWQKGEFLENIVLQGSLQDLSDFQGL